jgi:hypothetical protein
MRVWPLTEKWEIRLGLSLTDEGVLDVESINRKLNGSYFFLYGAAAHIGPWPPLYEVP